MKVNAREQRLGVSSRSEGLGLSGIREIFERAQKIPDVIRLEFGEPDFDTPENIKQAAIASIEQGKTKYTSSAGIPELRKAISEKLRTENGLDYDPATEIAVSAGATTAIYCSLVAILDVGDEILVPNPGWATYVYAMNLSGASPVPYPLREGNSYGFDRLEAEKLTSPKTKAILINSPSNPTGSIFSPKDIEAVAEFATDHDLYVLSDEVYEKFLYQDGREGKNNKHTSIATLSGMRDRTITINAMSKTYAMTGWRVGYTASNARVSSAISRINAAANSCISTVSQYAALEALTGPQDSVKEMISAFGKRRQMLVKSLNQIEGFRCLMPKGAFYTFPNIRETGLTSLDLSMKILDEAHVAVVPGSAFGSEGEGYIRIAYANSYENIELAIDRIRKMMRANC